jgi:hypothetical protein
VIYHSRASRCILSPSITSPNKVPPNDVTFIGVARQELCSCTRCRRCVGIAADGGSVAVLPSGFVAKLPTNIATDLTDAVYRRWLQSDGMCIFCLGADGMAYGRQGMHLVKRDGDQSPARQSFHDYSTENPPPSARSISPTNAMSLLTKRPCQQQSDTTDTASQGQWVSCAANYVPGGNFAWADLATGVIPDMPLPTQSTSLILTVAGGKRPASIGQANVVDSNACQGSPTPVNQHQSYGLSSSANHSRLNQKRMTVTVPAGSAKRHPHLDSYSSVSEALGGSRC